MAPSTHATSHQNGGSDEINVAGLSGELASNQPPKAHASTHESGGSDEITMPSATKQFFVPAAGMFVTGVLQNKGDHGVVTLVDATSDEVWFEFYVPDDFTTIVEAVVVVRALGTGNMQRDVSTDWGAVGENINANSGSIAAGVVALTANQIAETDVSAALSGIAAGDYVGLYFRRIGGHANDTINADVDCLGFMFKYS